MSAADLIAEARAAGLHLHAPAADRLKWICQNPPPMDLLMRLKAAKAEVLAVLLAEQAANDDQNAADRDYEIAERAAIAEHDGGLPADWADRLAELSYAPRPAGLPATQWQDRLEAVWRFADRHAHALHQQGWTFDDVFAVGGPWPRLDQRGAAWFCLDVREVEVTPDKLVWRAATGATQSFRRARLGTEKTRDGRSNAARPDLNKT